MLEKEILKLKLLLLVEIVWKEKLLKSYPEAEYMDTWVWFQSGINTDGAHNPKTNRGKLKRRYFILKYISNDIWILYCLRENIIFRSC